MEVHGAKKIIEQLIEAMSSSEGAEIKPGVRLLLPKQFSLVVTKTDAGVEVAFAPPADVFYKRAWGIISLHGTIETVILSPEDIQALIAGLPDQTFKVVS